MNGKFKRTISVLLCLATLFQLCGVGALAGVFTVVEGEGLDGGEPGFISAEDCVRENGILKKSFVYETDDGLIGLIDVRDSVLTATFYTKDFKLLPERSSAAATELPIIGGFYHAKNGLNYALFGDDNLEEDDSKRVLQLVKYDGRFNRLAGLAIRGGECGVSSPFAGGSAVFAENDSGELYVRLARFGYKDSRGLRRQSQLTVEVDPGTMTVKNDLASPQKIDASASLSQFALCDAGDMVFLDHGDASPRSIVLHRQNGSEYSRTELFKIPGDSDSEYTGVCAGGFEAAENNYLVAINSADHSKIVKYDNPARDDRERDVFLIAAEKDDVAAENVRLVRLTDYAGAGGLASVPDLIKISDGFYAVLWEKFVYSGSDAEYSSLNFAIVDENADVLKKGSYPGARLPKSGSPVFLDGKLLWYLNAPKNKRFCSLDLSDDIFELTHEHTLELVPAKESTCIVAGNAAYYRCSDPKCGKCFKDSEGKIPTTPEAEILPRAPHRGGKATCTERAVCVVCGTPYGELLPHTPGDWIVTVSPSTEAPGEKARYCSVCGKLLSVETVPKLKELSAGDPATGIRMFYPENAFPGAASLVAVENGDEAVKALVNRRLGESKIKAYDIAASVAGVKTEPAGEIKISIPLPAGFDPKFSKVYAVEPASGKTEELDAEFTENGFLFTADKSGIFVVAEDVFVLRVSPESLSLEKGQKTGITASAGGRPISFSSKNPSVASVDPKSGEVSAVGTGETDIVVTAASAGGDVVKTVRVTVKRNVFKEILEAIRRFFKAISDFFISLFAPGDAHG